MRAWIREIAAFVRNDGQVVGCARVLLIALCLLGLSSVFWSIPGGPMMAFVFGWIMAYIVGRREFLTGLLQPDAALWQWGWRMGWRQAWRETLSRFVIFFLWAPLLYSTPLRGIWILPLPSAGMALQKLVDRLTKRGQAVPADGLTGLFAHKSAEGAPVSNPLGEHGV